LEEILNHIKEQQLQKQADFILKMLQILMLMKQRKNNMVKFFESKSHEREKREWTVSTKSIMKMFQL
jgi:hypothetical protein